jgi:hypothetical protein
MQIFITCSYAMRVLARQSRCPLAPFSRWARALLNDMNRSSSMIVKALFAVAAVGLVSTWYLRSRPRAERSRGASAIGLTTDERSLESPNGAERLQASHALGAGEAPAAGDDTTWPASREFLRGA